MKPCKGNLHFFGEPNRPINFAKIQLLQHSARGRLTCINGSSWRVCFLYGNRWRLLHRIRCVDMRHSQAWTATRWTETRDRFVHLLNDFDIRVCNCRTLAPAFPALLPPVRWKFSNKSLIAPLFGPLVTLNFLWKLHLISTIPWSRQWNIRCSNE